MNTWYEANRRGWDAVASHWQADVDAAGLWQRTAAEPNLDLNEVELDLLGGRLREAVCVLGSGNMLVGRKRSPSR